MNKTKKAYYLLLFVFIGAFTVSCKIQEKDNVKIKIKVKPRPPKFLIQQLKNNEFKFETIAAKANVSTIDRSDKRTNFTTHLRIRKDSVIWISISRLSMEAARVIITTDTVKFLNRINKEYFIGDFSYINRALGTDLDYQMLEALLIGNSLDFDGNERLNSRVERKKKLYYLSTIKKRKVKKELKKEKEEIKGDGQVLWLDPNTFKVKELLLSSLEKHRTLTAFYADYRAIDTQLIPFKLRFLLKSNSLNTVEVEYAKFSAEKRLSFPFKISSKYVQLKK